MTDNINTITADHQGGVSELKWQEPPADARKKGMPHWDTVTAALKDHPGRWALVSEASHASLAVQIKTGRLVAFRPARSFEAVSRNRPDGKYDVYARFVGSDS